MKASVYAGALGMARVPESQLANYDPFTGESRIVYAKLTDLSGGAMIYHSAGNDTWHLVVWEDESYPGDGVECELGGCGRQPLHLEIVQ